MPNSCEHRIAKPSTRVRTLTFRWMIALSVPLLLISMLWITMHNSRSVARASGNETYVGTCTAVTPHFDAIQDAVLAAGAGTIINICPGVYTESVTLSSMSTMGDITLRRIPGTTDPVLINPSLDYAIGIAGEATFIGNITIESIDVTADEGSGILFGNVRDVQGSVIISDVKAIGSSDEGSVVFATGDILIQNSSLNNN